MTAGAPSSRTRSTAWPAAAASSAPGPFGPETSTMVCLPRGSQAVSCARATARRKSWKAGMNSVSGAVLAAAGYTGQAS